MGYLDRKLNRYQHEKNDRTDEQSGRGETRTDQTGEGHEPFVAYHKDEHQEARRQPENGVFFAELSPPHQIKGIDKNETACQ